MEKQLTLSFHHLYKKIMKNQEKIYQTQTSRLVAISNTSHQEPEGERSGFPVERSKDPNPTNLVAKGHPIDPSLSRHPKDNGVEEANVYSEILDVTYAIETTDPGDKIPSDKTRQLPSSHQTKQRAVGGEDQTNTQTQHHRSRDPDDVQGHRHNRD
ncbi:hypothetical protein OUZ56_003622 [Daphnia magna]|uniref:Uncharacterized protein n=1 Tax=Daphnia magna TaxID=35525 RepID=A0ABR0A9I6_9CRUS|nr:hypothetical protein OUZ56_003622 [Daphnia magna]